MLIWGIGHWPNRAWGKQEVWEVWEDGEEIFPPTLPTLPTLPHPPHLPIPHSPNSRLGNPILLGNVIKQTVVIGKFFAVASSLPVVFDLIVS